jgi:hypothetical protein
VDEVIMRRTVTRSLEGRLLAWALLPSLSLGLPMALLGVGCGGELDHDEQAAPTSPGRDGGVDALDGGVPQDDATTLPDASDEAVGEERALPPGDAGLPAPEAGPPPSPDSGMSPEGGPSPPVCAPLSPVIVLPAWRPPTALHQAACTASQISAYVSCVGSTGCTSTSVSCDACLQTDASAPAYGPIIVGTQASDGFGDAFVNWGGCQASFDGQTAAGSCGSETNAWQACANEVCPYTSCGSGSVLDACASYAYETVCAGHTESDACAAEWSAASSGVPQCADLVTLATLWCGM